VHVAHVYISVAELIEQGAKCHW